MYRQPVCSSKSCNTFLYTIGEVITRLCNYHHLLALDDNSYIGVCWRCGDITIVETKVLEMSDKYLFSKNCNRCLTDKEDPRVSGIDWMTTKHWKYNPDEYPKHLSNILIGKPISYITGKKHVLYPTYYRKEN